MAHQCFIASCFVADAWSVLLPASLPPSYRGHSHRIGQLRPLLHQRHYTALIGPATRSCLTLTALFFRVSSVYYVSAAAYRGEQLLLNIKLPFRVRVTPPYYEGYSEEKVIVQLPLTLTITSTIEHRRLHPPLLQEVTNQSEAAAAVDAAVVGTASHVASVAEREHVGSVQNDALVSFTGGDSDSLLSPPARQVFPTATLQRSYSANSSTPQLVLLPSALSAESHAASSFLTDFSPATPPTPPTPDYRSIRAKIHDLRLSQLKNEPTTFPSCLPSSQLLSTFLSAIRTPLSFNISEQSQPTSTSPIASLPVTHIRVERSAFRPGDTVRLSFDFSAAALPTYRAWLTLDWLEETVGGLRHVQSVASAHVYCLSAVEVPVELQLPRDATCNWASSLMRGGWRLSFHFVIGRPRSISSKRTGGSWWLVGMADVEEERVERERLEREERRRAETLLARVEGKESAVSSVSMAMMCAGDPSLQVSCLQWELPLNVVPMYDDSEPMPATKSGVLDVQYI